MYKFYKNSTMIGYPISSKEWTVDAVNVTQIRFLVIPTEDNNEV